MRRAVWPLLLISVLAPFSWAQQSAPVTTKQGTGRVVGRVYCSDTNLPARMAKVSLLPTRDVDDFKAAAPGEIEKFSPVTTIETGLDGSFTIDAVKPGKYYLIVEKDGYLSPTSLFTDEELQAPTLAVKRRIAKTFQQITVDPGLVVSVEVRLERAAAISGSVHFDDGGPAAGLAVKALRKDKDGKWKAVRLSSAPRLWNGIKTDDRGGYRIAGLPPAEYIVGTDLTISETVFSNLLGTGSSVSFDDKFSLPFFSGGSTRPRDAAAFKLTEGEERTGEDIVVPLAKLHPVTGSVTAKRDGHVVNAAKLSLLYADDRSEMASTRVDAKDAAFHFQFVPEGEYILSVKNASDVVREEVPTEPGSMPPSFTREKAFHSYGDSEQSLTIRGDTDGVLIPVPEKTGTSEAK